MRFGTLEITVSRREYECRNPGCELPMKPGEECYALIIKTGINFMSIRLHPNCLMSYLEATRERRLKSRPPRRVNPLAKKPGRKSLAEQGIPVELIQQRKNVRQYITNYRAMLLKSYSDRPERIPVNKKKLAYWLRQYYNPTTIAHLKPAPFLFGTDLAYVFSKHEPASFSQSIADCNGDGWKIADILDRSAQVETYDGEIVENMLRMI